MGLEVGDGSVEATAMAEEVRSDDPVEALLGLCEALDLGDKAAEEPVVADSNGHLTEGEAGRIGVDDAGRIGAVAEVARADGAGDIAEESRAPGQVKNWSDFNAVSARTFGEQTFGSFSDFLANQPDLAADAPAQSSGAPDLGSDVDFFERGGLGSEPMVAGAMGVTTAPSAAVVEDALGVIDERPAETGPAMAQGEVAVPQVSEEQDLGAGQQVQTWSDLPVVEEQTVVAGDAGAEADPYPGWWYDYQAGEWRQVEGYNAIAGGAGYGGNHVESHHLQTISEANAFQVEESQGLGEQGAGVAGEVGLEQSGSWDTQSAATQTVADEYPGWTWDYVAQTWVATAGYNDQGWQSSSEAQVQDYGGEQSWYGQQERHTQTYVNEPTVASYTEEAVGANEQQPQGLSGYAFDGANVSGNGYASQSENPVSSGSVYRRESNQWQGQAAYTNATAGGASNFYSPQMNGDQGWASGGLNRQEQFGNQSMSFGAYASGDGYYGHPGSGGQMSFQQQPQPQQGWGNASHFNQYQQYTNPTAPPPKSVQEAMRTCSGRPPHSLAAFGFGGKLIYMKHRDPVTLHTSDGDQAFASGEAWMPGPIQVSSLKAHVPQDASFAGPLMGGGVSTKELIKWMDERMSSRSAYDSSRLLMGVLKVACQHYGKLRSSNANSGNTAVEEDGPEAALAKLLGGGGGEQSPYVGLANTSLALRGAPSEQQLQTAAVEVKKLLVCGKRKGALKCAQEGELWGIALVIARQLGEKFFCDTVTEMARRQFVSGSPLRTLSLLLAGQPAEVFAAPNSGAGNAMVRVAGGSDQSEDGQGAMLDDWQENIAIMAANRTQGDERVMLHLGDRLWGVRGEVAAAHLCYLVADANLESYTGGARLCLIGADHVKNPRTFVTAEAIQRTEIYEHAKVLGNPQSVLLSFQPYKLVYAEMLIECGKTGDSLKYCQTVLKTLKAAGMRSAEVEACRVVASNLEERLRVHLQDGPGKLAPRKLVKSIKGTMDWGISKLIGGIPPTSPAADAFGYRALDNGDKFGSQSSCPGSSAGQRSGAQMAPSASIAASMERLPQEPNRGPSRSQSEPDFSGRYTKQGGGDGNMGASPRAAGLRLAGLGRLGSNILQKATGLWSYQNREAKLGDANKFYYDEKLKKWVEEGADPTPDIAPPPPPPTTSSFMGPVPSQEDTQAPPPAVTSKPGTPPLAPNSSNHYSNRRQAGGVRSRYVDTFNKGGSAGPAKSVMGSLMPPLMPGAGMMSTPAMFVPGPAPTTSFSEGMSDVGDNFVVGSSRNGDASSNQGPLSDTASSNPITGTGVGHPPASYSTIPQVSSGNQGFASFKADSGDFNSVGEPPVFGAGHTKSSSWSGYPSSFQNPLIPGEEDVFGASFSGHDRLSHSEHVPHMASASAGQSGYANVYLPNGSGSSGSWVPGPAVVAPSTGLGETRDLNRQSMGQGFRGSQSVDSLTGEEMQEVEL